MADISDKSKTSQTVRQQLGNNGENFVASNLDCPKCLAHKSHVLLRSNTPCVDVVCQGCGVESQVKSISLKKDWRMPSTVLGGSWKAKNQRIKDKGFSPYFFVFFDNRLVVSVLYLTDSAQKLDYFKIRKPLSARAKSPGWTGYELKPREWATELICIWGTDFHT